MFTSIISLLALSRVILASAIPSRTLDNRDGVIPHRLHTSGRWVLNSSGHRVKLRCVNWAGHMETNIPEGLQHQPVDAIASWLASSGFNCVRLTYSVDMAINPQVKVSDSFDTAASLTGVDATEMRNLYARAVKQNPWLGTATVLDAFSTVIGSLHTAGLAVILDNHVSHASWCCSGSDGNGWWKSPGLLPSVLWNSWNNRYFDTDSWIKSLTAMASFASTQPGVVGMSLRNELRTSDSWYVARGMWKEWVSKGANAVNTVDPSLLVIIGGLDYATDLSWVYNDDAELIVPNRTVWEFHWYSWSHGSTDCGELKDQIGHQAGFLLTQGRLYTAPLWLSEFGSQMSGDLEDDGYLSCVVDYMSSNDAEWAVWALQGSYYIRDGNIDADEQFGVMTRDWSGWRNSQLPKKLGSMWNMTQGP